jgi:hypothetical protein
MSAAAEENKQVRLTTSDNADLKVDRDIVERSILIKNMLEDLGDMSEESIPIPNVCTESFSHTIRAAANYHTGQRSRDEEGPRVVRASPQRPRRVAG